jgi:hypothetical protein
MAVPEHEEARRVPATRVLRVKRLKDVRLSLIETRLNDLERRILQRRIGPQQATKIGWRHAQIRSVGNVARMMRQNFCDQGFSVSAPHSFLSVLASGAA